MNHHFEAFIDDLRATHGTNLVAVILYGSAAAGDFIPHRSDLNLLVALEKITPKDLQNAHACVREWVKTGHPIPVYFTVSELQNAADVFPIEFHQMEDARKVLYGRDVLEGVVISDGFLRHQAEYELRSKLLMLRRSYIAVSESAEGLAHLMSESLASFSSIFRAVLMLQGVPASPRKHEITKTLVRTLGLDGAVFDRIFAFRENKPGPEFDVVAANALFAEYLEQIEKVIGAVDAAGKN